MRPEVWIAPEPVAELIVLEGNEINDAWAPGIYRWVTCADTRAETIRMLKYHGFERLGYL